MPVVDVATGTGNIQGYAGSGTILGFTLSETVGTSPVLVELRDATSAGTGNFLGVMRVVANGFASTMVPATGFSSGVYVNRSGGGSGRVDLYLM